MFRENQADKFEIRASLETACLALSSRLISELIQWPQSPRPRFNRLNATDQYALPVDAAISQGEICHA